MKKNNPQIEKLLNSLKDMLSLTEKEKDVLRLQFADQLYVTNQNPARTSWWSKIFIQNKINNKSMPILLYALAILVALGGGTVVLADEAKPGDTLYPVDQFVERVQERLTVDGEARVRLFGRFDEERRAELEALHGLNPEELSEQARERWEQHKEEAAERVAESTERMNAMKVRFEEKLAEAETEEEREVFQNVLNHLGEMETRREEHFDRIEKGEFPGEALEGLPIRERIREWQHESSEEAQEIMEQIREAIEEEFPPVKGFGEEMPPNPRFPNDTDDEGFGNGDGNRNGNGAFSS